MMNILHGWLLIAAVIAGTIFLFGSAVNLLYIGSRRAERRERQRRLAKKQLSIVTEYACRDNGPSHELFVDILNDEMSYYRKEFS